MMIATYNPVTYTTHRAVSSTPDCLTLSVTDVPNNDNYLPRPPPFASPTFGSCVEQPTSKLEITGSVYPLIDSKRLWHEIHHTAQWGAIASTMGMDRLTLNDDDKAMRDYFVSEATSLGCKVRVDEIGNIFAILPGENDNVPPIGMGSHLDTQPAGGRFDGILGVLGALEVLRTIRQTGYKSYAPLAAINWTNEEGSRFQPGCTGSAVWANYIPLSQAYALEDANRCKMGEELERIGYAGATLASYQTNPLSAHFEVHIEQRRRLQDAHKKIAIVTGIQGVRWYQFRIHGERAHAGSKMEERGDTLMITAKILVFVENKALELGANATVGTVSLEKPSLNIVPGFTSFTLDMRHPCEATLTMFEAAIQSFVAVLQSRNPRFSHEVTRIWRSPAVEMDADAMSCTRAAADRVVGRGMTMDLHSLAGHDSALVAMRAPTSMIFVPCKDGISHAPEEYSTEEQCANGVQVLLEAVLHFDDQLRARHGHEAIETAC